MQPVRGTHDLLPEESLRFQHVINMARETAQLYGFGEISTPIFEFTSVFQKTLGEASDIVSKEMYTFVDKGGESLTLRPEGTAGVARAFISEGLSQHLPLKLFYQGAMFRRERPQKGRQRQFHQIGIEFLGVANAIADLECISMASLLLKKLGLEKKSTLYVNSIGDSDSRKTYREALVKYLKDYKTQLSPDSQRRLEQNPLRILDSKEDVDKEIVSGAPQLKDFLNESSKTFFNEVLQGLKDLEVPYKIDSRLVRGLDYYNHTVFEFKAEGLGAQDTLLAGGRYDGLIEMMGGPSTPGVGWAAGLERLVLVGEQYPQPPRPVTLIPLGEEAERASLKILHELREKGIYIEMAYSGNLSKRMKKANATGSLKVLILGSEELKKGTFMLKDLDTGVQLEVPIKNIEQHLL